MDLEPKIIIMRTSETYNPYTWERALSQKEIYLYAGPLWPDLAQFNTHIGLCPEYINENCIIHDVRKNMPIPDYSVEIYQSEDVFEHIEYDILPQVFNEIYRVLKAGGLFRLSLPDYRCDILRNRSVYNDCGKIIFDPGGGGKLEDGIIVDGGHLWFPLLEDVMTLYQRSQFNYQKINLLHGYIDYDNVVLNAIDYSLGHILRTPDHDVRVANPYRPMSIVIDAYK